MRRILIAGTATALVASGVLVSHLAPQNDKQVTAAPAPSGSCAPGFVSISSVAREVANEMVKEGESAEAAQFQLELAESVVTAHTDLVA